LFDAATQFFGETNRGTSYNPYGRTLSDAYSRNVAGDYGSSNESFNIHYQHIFEFKGQHIVDFGFNRDYSEAESNAAGAQYYFTAPGRIDTGLDPLRIYNDGSGVPLDSSFYAGKYIVFNPARANVSNVDPYMINNRAIGALENFPYNGITYPDGTPLLGLDGKIYDSVTETFHPYIGSSTNAVPNYTERWGAPHGGIYSTVISFYANDMWTIDNHHSIMIGIRFNHAKLEDDNYQVVDRYGNPTYINWDIDRVTPRIKTNPLVNLSAIDPRFEYKFDVHGDQRRLFAASFALFSSVSNLSMYSMFTDRKWDNVTRYYWTGDNTQYAGSPYAYLVDYDQFTDFANYTQLREIDTTFSGSYTYELDPNFKPPVTTEYSIWYRRSYDTGGWWKVAYVHRTWSNLYDYFAGTSVSTRNPMTGGWTDRIMTTLKNTTDFSRQYNGVELSWDIPINKRFSFGGNYTWARQLDNQTVVGRSLSGNRDWSDSNYAYASESNATDLVTQTSPPWSILWYWDEKFADLGGRSTYMPYVNRNPEFNAGYYIIFNLTQGRAKSNFTLRGAYTGAYEMQDRITYYFGYPNVPNISDPVVTQGNTANRIQGLRNGVDVIVNTYTGAPNHYHNLTYNLTLPIVKKLSWYVNINVTNVFNHRPKFWSVPGGTIGDYVPYDIMKFPPNENEVARAANDAFNEPSVYGRWRSQNDVLGYYKKGGLGVRYFELSTGLRF
jgi:hypothetical protein